MAIGPMKRAGVRVRNGTIVVPASCKATWITAHDDLEQTVPTTPLNPATISNAEFHWVKVPDGATRCIVRAKYTKSATVTTSPVVRIIGACPGESAVDKAPPSGEYINEDGSFPDDGTIEFMRLDLAASAGTGTTLTLVSSGADLMFDAHATPKAYSDPTSLTPIDLLGSWYVGIVPVTAANVSTGVVVGQIMFMN